MKPKPFDAHDEEERRAILEILNELPEDHRARRAHREGADAIALAHLADDRQDLIERLKQAWLDGYGGYFEELAAFGADRNVPRTTISI